MEKITELVIAVCKENGIDYYALTEAEKSAVIQNVIYRITGLVLPSGIEIEVDTKKSGLVSKS